MKLESYSLNDLTVIGRKALDLSEDYHCFMAEVKDFSTLRYGLQAKNEKGEYYGEEVYSYISLVKSV